MGQLYDEDWEHVDIEAFREAIVGNGVISGLGITESATPAMTILTGVGTCVIDGVVYTEGSGYNLNISNGHATYDRKDIVVYDASMGNPVVVEGTASAAPTPPDIPSGDILLGIVLVEANETTSIVNADITDDRVYTNTRWAHTAVSSSVTLTDAHYVVTVNAAGGSCTISLPTAAGRLGKVYIVKRLDSTANAVTLNGYGAETIDGAATLSIVAQWEAAYIQSDGSNWLRLVTHRSYNEVRDAVEAATDSNTFNDYDHTKLNGIDVSADVTDATTVNAAGAVMNSDYTANSIMGAVSSGSPTAYSIAYSSVLGRASSGNIQALNSAEIRTMINVVSGADVTGSNPPQSHGHTLHTNRTRRFWSPAIQCSYVGGVDGYTFSPTEDNYITTYFRMPADYVSSVYAILHYHFATTSSNSVVLRADAMFGESDTQSRMTHATIDNPNTVTPGANDYNFTYSFDSSLLALVTADDVVRLKISRTGTAAADTHPSILYGTGIEIQYTSEA